MSVSNARFNCLCTVRLRRENQRGGNRGRGIGDTTNHRVTFDPVDIGAQRHRERIIVTTFHPNRVDDVKGTMLKPMLIEPLKDGTLRRPALIPQSVAHKAAFPFFVFKAAAPLRSA